MQFRDFSLLIATIIAAIVGVYSPWAAQPLGFVPLYGMMGLLYICFTPLRFDSLAKTVRLNIKGIAWFVIVRMFLFPSLVYGLFRLLAPDYALAGLLLSGAATAVVAPFMAYLLEVDVAFTTVLTVASSFLLPFTLPFVVMFWAGAEIDISPFSMVATLAQMILLPATAAFLTQRFLPALVKPIQKQTFFWGLTITCCSTLVIFFALFGFLFRHTRSHLERPGGGLCRCRADGRAELRGKLAACARCTPVFHVVFSFAQSCAGRCAVQRIFRPARGDYRCSVHDSVLCHRAAPAGLYGSACKEKRG